MTAASIRTNNPGAMWGGSHAKRWGATDDLILKDGQSNHIAVFPTKVKGAAAQFDLWRRAYTGLSLTAAIRKWSGGNSSSAYMAFLTKHTGLAAESVVTADVLAGPKGIALMKAQAQWEAGQPYPMSDEEWTMAQRLVFPGKATPVPKPAASSKAANVAIGAAVATTSAAVAKTTGFPWWIGVAAIVAVGIAIVIVKQILKRK